MLYLFLGIIIGLLLAVIALQVVIYYKKSIERKLEQMKNTQRNRGGEIIRQDNQVQIAQKRIIDENQDKGGTKLVDLMN